MLREFEMENSTAVAKYLSYLDVGSCSGKGQYVSRVVNDSPFKATSSSAPTSCKNRSPSRSCNI